MKRLLATPLALAAALLLLFPLSASAALPRAGVFHGGIAGVESGGDGWFRAKHTTNGWRLVGPGGAIPQVVAPTDLVCNVGAAYLPVTKLRVRADGSFSWQGLIPTIGPDSSDVTVTFRGSFVTRRKATGTTKVVGDGCNSGVDDWTMLLEA